MHENTYTINLYFKVEKKINKNELKIPSYLAISIDLINVSLLNIVSKEQI